MGSQDHFERLPHEMLTKIFRTAVWKKEIDIRTLSRLERVCRRFRRVAKEITVLSENCFSQNTKEQFLQFMARNHRAWEGIKIRIGDEVDPMPIIQAAIAPAVRSLRFVKIDSGFLEGLTWDILTVLLEQCSSLAALSVSKNRPSAAPFDWRLHSGLTFLELGPVNFTSESLSSLLSSLPLLSTLKLNGFVSGGGDDDDGLYTISSTSLRSLSLWDQHPFSASVSVICPVLESLSLVVTNMTGSLYVDCPALRWLKLERGSGREMDDNTYIVPGLKALTGNGYDEAGLRAVCLAAPALTTLALQFIHSNKPRLHLKTMPQIADVCPRLKKMVISVQRVPTMASSRKLATWINGFAQLDSVSLIDKAGAASTVAELLKRTEVRLLETDGHGLAGPRVVHRNMKWKGANGYPSMLKFPKIPQMYI